MTELEIISKIDDLSERKAKLETAFKKSDKNIQVVLLPLIKAKNEYLRKKTKSRSNLDPCKIIG